MKCAHRVKNRYLIIWGCLTKVKAHKTPLVYSEIKCRSFTVNQLIAYSLRDQTLSTASSHPMAKILQKVSNTLTKYFSAHLQPEFFG